YLALSEDPAAETIAEQSSATLTVATARGTIYDRNGYPLVNRSRELRLCVAPYTRTMSALAEGLADEVFLPLSERLKSGRPIVMIADEDFPDVRGVLRFRTPTRYGEQVYAPHLLGYLNAEGRGAVGLELAYDTFLQNCEGRLTATYEINAAGHLLTDTAPIVNDSLANARAGLMLTLDRDIQQYAEQVASQMLPKGAVLVADAATAEILAAVSAPSFQPETVASLLEARDAPLMDRTLCNYNCGSVFKIVSAAAALESGVPVSRQYDCHGAYNVDGVSFHCHNRLGHGRLTLEEAFALSCNCYFIQLIEEIGAEHLYQTAVELGFDRAVIPAERYKTARATLPTLSELQHNAAALANLSFGQGGLLATPYHMIQMLSAVVNDGVMQRPSVVYGTVDDQGGVKADGITPGQTAFSPVTATVLRQLMIAAVAEGATGESAAPANGGAGGKTGTAESGWFTENGETVQNWFVGYYPAEQPRYLLAVLAEDYNNTKTSAATIFNRLCDGLYTFMDGN
ncbi:MAG: penicillin-binding protein 2, partial [Ruminococcaceae bacterium]|nr:penicillin-binding protein 2 [Oscillospiraceae bacterium]